MVTDGKKAELLERVKKENIHFIQLQFTDIHGMPKSVTLPTHRLAESLEKGTWFDGSSIDGFARICESDMYLMPDPGTFAVIPWENGDKATARIICDVFTPDGKPFEGDPRYILKKVMAEAMEMGWEYNVGPELEFFLFKRNEHGEVTTETHDTAGYFDYAPRDLAEDVRKEITSALQCMGIEVEMAHHEVAPGQHEIDFKYGNAVKTADNATTLKLVVKSIANRHGLYATFMPKPIFGINGSGMHVHQSLFDIKTNRNIFFDPDDKYKLSSSAKSFVAGQFAHVRGFSAVIAPTVNSYKRLVPGYEAPVYIVWARINRSALIRIPRYSPGRDQSTRAELRCPDPSCNPYLAFAVMLKAGIDGIKRKLVPPEPVEEDVYEFEQPKLDERGISTLPGSLGEALEELKKDKVVQEALGSHTCALFLAAKKDEWDNYRIRVTEWEVKKYLEML